MMQELSSYIYPPDFAASIIFFFTSSSVSSFFIGNAKSFLSGFFSANLLTEVFEAFAFACTLTEKVFVYSRC